MCLRLLIKLFKLSLVRGLKSLGMIMGVNLLIEFLKKFNDKEIIHETMCVGTSRQNGVAKRKNRHILEMARALLFENHIPQRFWDCEVTMAVYVINRLASESNDFQTP